MPTPRFIRSSAAGISFVATLLTPVLIAAGFPEQSKASAVDSLIDTDSQLGRASASGRGVEVLLEVFEETVIAPMPTLDFPASRAMLIDQLQAENSALSAVEWSPARAGVSADGMHGFTLGHVKIGKDANRFLHMKYLAYWVKRPTGWRMVAFKRVPRPEGNTRFGSTVIVPTAPDQRDTHGQDYTESDAASLIAAERAFSAEAQKIGLGPAFAKYGRADAINLGRGPDFTIGAANIGREIGEGSKSPVSWEPDGVLVAPSGDLGLSWGRIRAHDVAHANQTIPFFTIWKRDGREAPWRYVAE